MSEQAATIRAGFEEKIRSGRLRPGDRLPTEAEIMVEHHVSRGTVSRALRDLEMQGLLRRKRGDGTYVADWRKNGDSAVAGRSPNQSPSRSHRQNEGESRPAGPTARTEFQEKVTVSRVGMLMPWTDPSPAGHYFQSEMHHAMAALCGRHGVDLTLGYLGTGEASVGDKLLQAARRLLERSPEVVLFCPVELPPGQMGVNQQAADLLADAGVQVIMVGRDLTEYPQRSRFPWVSFENRRSGTMLTMHLVERGYRRIAFVGAGVESTAIGDRQAGYIDGLERTGVGVERSLIFLDRGDPAALHDQILQARPDAVICKTTRDAVALGVHLLRKGITIGRDIGLAGFDDDPLAQALPVTMTVIRQPLERFIAAAFHLTNRLAETTHHPLDGQHIAVATELIARESTLRS